MPGPEPTSTSAQGAATRLLVLGCVRIFQPVHGYFLRRELATWEIESWARIHPGSIYNALKTLTRAGLLAEIESPAGNRPQRTTYVLTRGGRRGVPRAGACRPARRGRPDSCSSPP